VTVYMLRHTKTGLFYRRTKGNYSPDPWVEQKKASIWTSRNGPAQAKSILNRKGHLAQIIPFELVEKP
jgi:hypothetical protein